MMERIELARREDTHIYGGILMSDRRWFVVVQMNGEWYIGYGNTYSSGLLVDDNGWVMVMV